MSRFDEQGTRAAGEIERLNVELKQAYQQVDDLRAKLVTALAKRRAKSKPEACREDTFQASHGNTAWCEVHERGLVACVEEQQQRAERFHATEAKLRVAVAALKEILDKEYRQKAKNSAEPVMGIIGIAQRALAEIEKP